MFRILSLCITIKIPPFFSEFTAKIMTWSVYPWHRLLSSMKNQDFPFTVVRANQFPSFKRKFTHSYLHVMSKLKPIQGRIQSYKSSEGTINNRFLNFQMWFWAKAIINSQLSTNLPNGDLDKDSKTNSKWLMDPGQSGTETSHGKSIMADQDEVRVHMDISLYIWPDKARMGIRI